MNYLITKDRVEEETKKPNEKTQHRIDGGGKRDEINQTKKSNESGRQKITMEAILPIERLEVKD